MKHYTGVEVGVSAVIVLVPEVGGCFSLLFIIDFPAAVRSRLCSSGEERLLNSPPLSSVDVVWMVNLPRLESAADVTSLPMFSNVTDDLTTRLVEASVSEVWSPSMTSALLPADPSGAACCAFLCS